MEWEREVLIYLLTDVATGIRLGPSRQPITPMWACVGTNSSELGLSSAAHLNLSLGGEFRELYYKETTSLTSVYRKEERGPRNMEHCHEGQDGPSTRKTRT